MPRGGDADAHVDEMYHSIEGLLSDARAVRRPCVVGGDWDATVGARQPSDDADAVGLRGVGDRDARGEMVAQWAAGHHLALANAISDRDSDNMWTRQRGTSRRQLDYFW
eukprot:5063345-Pyramimonas_sp.AAC.1